ncbi:hypothetical protein YQE_01672, partial [Dendroctonus ponderosae]
MGGDVSLKLPFTLMHTCNDYDGETLTRVVVEINKTDQKSPTDPLCIGPEVIHGPQRPLTLHFCKNGDSQKMAAEEPEAHKPEKKQQNLDEIVTLNKSDSEIEKLPTGFKQNGAQYVECHPNGEQGAFFSLRRAFCCLRTRRSS